MKLAGIVFNASVCLPPCNKPKSGSGDMPYSVDHRVSSWLRVFWQVFVSQKNLVSTVEMQT